MMTMNLSEGLSWIEESVLLGLLSTDRSCVPLLHLCRAPAPAAAMVTPLQTTRAISAAQSFSRPLSLQLLDCSLIPLLSLGLTPATAAPSRPQPVHHFVRHCPGLSPSGTLLKCAPCCPGLSSPPYFCRAVTLRAYTQYAAEAASQVRRCHLRKTPQVVLCLHTHMGIHKNTHTRTHTRTHARNKHLICARDLRISLHTLIDAP